jgi:hypothetical protein
MTDTIKNFINRIHTRPVITFRLLAERLGVPYLEERRGERRLGHRLKEVSDEEAIKQGLFPTRRFRSPTGEILETNEWPPTNYEQLTDEVWSRDNFPTSYNTIQEAVQKLPNGIKAMYFHLVSLTLVLVAPDGELVGVRKSIFCSEDDFAAFDVLKKVTTH